MKRAVLGLVVLATLLCSASITHADDTEIGSWGGTVRPMQSTTVRMSAETVQCVCYRSMARYRVHFRFENSGEPQRLKLGFPFYVGGDTVDPAAGFHAWADGRALPVALEHGTDNGVPTDFFAHEVEFRTGVTTVAVDYLVAATGSNMGGYYGQAARGTPFAGTTGSVAEYYYTLHTGANWAGTIGTAVLRWDLSPDFVGGAVPQASAMLARMSADAEDPEDPEGAAFGSQRRAIANQRVQIGPLSHQWTMRDFEPTQTADGSSAYDVALYALVPSGYDHNEKPNQYCNPEVRASSWLRLDGYEYRADALVDGLPATAWAEDASGSGIGQHVDFKLRGKKTIRELRILPGYAKRPDLFRKYNRPKRLRFDFADGTSKTVALADDPTLQIFPVHTAATSARMTILDVYRGTTRDETYISEVELGTAESPKFESFESLLRSAEPSRAASASVAATLPTAPPTDPPAWRSVVAVLLGAAVLAGVALGTGLLGREPQQDNPPDS